LTHRQASYAQLLIDKNSNKAMEMMALADSEWKKEWEADPELRKKSEVVASYYLTTPYYNNDAKGVLSALGKTEEVRPLPSKSRLYGMISNKYAENVWESHTSEPKWKVGDMVAIRKSHKGELRLGNKIATHSYHANSLGLPMFDDLTYVIVEVDSKPISESYQYDSKRGGCRYYKLLPVCIAATVHFMECNLKKVLKKKVTR